MCKPRILCVDDEAVNLKLYDAVLQPQGYEVLHAQSGARALEMVRAQKIDLVLMDVMMPEMNGYDVCRQIKEDPERRATPVVLITSLQSRKERTKGIEAGAEDFISKPIDQGEVLARIRMLLRLKDLNEQLAQAYDRVTALATFGAETLRTLDPSGFELMPQIDRLVGRIIRQSSDATDRPSIVVVGIRAVSGWRWVHYEAPFRELTRNELDLKAPDFMALAANEEPVSFYADRSEFAGRGLDAFVARLESHPRLLSSIQNLYAYQSRELCVFAANYARAVGVHEAAILEALATQSRLFKLFSDQLDEAEAGAAHSVDSLLRIAAFHDEDASLHPQRVGEYCALLSAHLGLAEPFVRAIRLQARLHDVGNVNIPAEILKKEGSPDFQEWEIIRAHTRLGAEIIGGHPRLAMARVIALGHHENWDGSGYPNWLRGEQIPLAARIAALADRYDVLRSARPYKPAIDHRSACELILHGNERTRPEHFDPAMLAAFQELAPRFAETYDRMQDAACERRAG
jgi:response regulator RpfG family c-di-GMP phosphodiesterase